MVKKTFFIHKEILDLGLKPYEFTVYAELVNICQKHGFCTYSVKDMAKKCRISQNTYRKFRDTLSKPHFDNKPLIFVESRKDPNDGSWETDRITINEFWR